MIAIIGGGLAGLACARELAAVGRPARVLEASPRLGGRVATDSVGGYLVDRGFQVLLDSYAEVRPHLGALQPQYFDSGAILWDRGRRWTLRNPLFHPGSAPASGLSGVLSVADKLAILRLVGGSLMRSDSALLAAAARVDYGDLLGLLRMAGLSPTAVERFFRPFFGGVFLDDSLSASAALFRFYLKKFTLGRAFVPNGGAGRFPEVLASVLPEGSVQTGCRVEGWELTSGRVSALRLASGMKLAVDQVILAMGPGETSRFLGIEAPPMTSVATLALGGKTSLYPDRLLVLPAGRRRVVRHLVQLSNICPAVSPGGHHLVVATLLGGHESSEVIRQARAEIAEIFPAEADLDLVDFRVTREATLLSGPGGLRPRLSTNLPPNVTLAGDMAGWSCVESSLKCGRRAAQKADTEAGRFGPS